MKIKSKYSSIRIDEEKVFRKVFESEGTTSENEIRKDLALINDLLSIQQLYDSKRKIKRELEKRISQDIEA